MRRSFMGKAISAIEALITRRVEIPCDGISYHFEGVPLRKILNWILVEASVFFRPERPWGGPTHLQIEGTNLCNLRCALCPVTTGMQRDSGYMEYGLFTKIVDETAGSVFLLLLWDWGEPFLHPRIFDMISHARQRGMRVVCSTNGHMLANDGYAERLIRSGLDTLIVAMDGVTQQTYEKYRCGGSLERVLEGVRALVEKKREMDSGKPLVNLRFIAMKHNEHEIPDFGRIAETLGVDAAAVRALCPFDNIREREAGADEEFTPMNPSYQRFRQDAGTGRRIRRLRNPCKTPWNNPTVHWNGVVCPCTFDPHEKNSLGNLAHASMKEIWSGEKYRSFRRRFRRDYRDMAICRECTNAYAGGTCSTEDIIEVRFFSDPPG